MKSILFTKPKQLTLDCLKLLVDEGEEILGVILFEKDQYCASDFCQYCEKKNLPVYDYSQVDDVIMRHQHEIDMIYCNTFPKRLKKEWFQYAKIAAINFHGGPLPDYRGIFSYNFAFLNHETDYGVTCHFLAEQFDQGGIIEVLRFPFDFNSGSVKELVDLASCYIYQLFRKTYHRFKSGEKVTGITQTGGRYYSREDFENLKQINLQDDGEAILNKIRAFWMPPFTGSYAMIAKKKVMLVLEDDYLKLVKRDE